MDFQCPSIQLLHYDFYSKVMTIKDHYFIIANQIIILLGLALLLATVSFILGYGITPLHFPFAMAGSLFLSFFLLRKYSEDRRRIIINFLLHAVIFGIVIVSSFFLAGIFYDISWDGQTYHLETVIRLKNGWNPVYFALPDTNIYAYCINTFAKAGEIIQSCIYSTTGLLEVCKSTNILLLIATFALCLSFLYSLPTIAIWARYLVALLVILNPVVLLQLFTHYIDGMIALLFTCMMLLMMLLIKSKEYDKQITLIMLNIMLMNMKFTALGYVILSLAIFLVYLMIFKFWVKVKMVFIISSISLLTGLFLSGFNPYVTNTVKHHHPFYPYAGPEKYEDIFIFLMPQAFLNKPRVEKLFLSVFAESSYDTVVRVKVPFTFTKSELYPSSEYDIKLGGFGVLFSGCLIIAFFLMILLLCMRMPRSYRFNLLFAFAGILILSIFIPEPWLARYIPQFWLLLIIPVVFSLMTQNRALRSIAYLLSFLMIINSGIILLYNVKKNMAAKSKIVNQMQEIKKSDKKVLVDFGPFYSIEQRFIKEKVDYSKTTIIDDSVAGEIPYTWSRAKFTFE